MKWHRPQAYFVPPFPHTHFTGGGDTSSPLYSEDGQFVCAHSLASSSAWSIVQDPFLHARVDGEVLEPAIDNYFNGDLAWSGETWTLNYSIAHEAWILHDGTLGATPTAYQDWATNEWKGSAWYQGRVSEYKAGKTFTFAPKGTLLNGESPASKTVELFLPRWEWEDDGFSKAPIGKYVGKDGCTGTKFIGSAAYVESGTENVWFRRGEGYHAFLKREDSSEQSSERSSFRGPGRGWGILREDVLFFSAALPTGEESASFAPWTWDEESKRYVPAEGVDPLELTYRGRTMGREVVDGYFTETMQWR